MGVWPYYIALRVREIDRETNFDEAVSITNY